MRILHLVGSLGYGGIERLVTDLSIHQMRRGYSTAVCCLLRHEGEFSKVLKEKGVPVLAVGGTNGKPWRISRPLNAIIKSWSPGIIHSHVNFSLLWQFAPMPFRRRPFLITQHSLLALRPAMKFRSRIIYLMIRPLISRHVAVSSYAAAHAARLYGIAPEKIYLVYNGIDPQKYAFNLQAREDLRTAWGVPPKGILWGSVGRLDRIKGYDLFLRGFAEARKVNPNLFLAVAGDGPCHRELSDLTRALDCQESVHWLGKQNAIKDILSTFDFYVQPSLKESLSLSVLEALACGLNVMASNVGGIKEIARVAENVTLFHSHDKAHLASNITKLSRRLSSSADRSSKLPSLFSFEKMAESYENLYFQIAR